MTRLIAALVLLCCAACKPKPADAPTEAPEATAAQEDPAETGTPPVDVPPSDKPMVMETKASDAGKLACAQIAIDVDGSEAKKALDVEEMGTEGAYAEAFTIDGAVVRITGGKLFESQREAFDYFYADGKLLCASESRNSLHVINAENEGWELWWHEQYLVFNKGGGLVSLSADFTSNGGTRGAEPSAVLQNANELFAIASK